METRTDMQKRSWDGSIPCSIKAELSQIDVQALDRLLYDDQGKQRIKWLLLSAQFLRGG